MPMTFDQLYSALSDPSVYNQAAHTLTLTASTLGSGSISALFSDPFATSSLVIRNVGSLVRDDVAQTITAHGTSTVSGYIDAATDAVFTVANSDSGTQEAQLLLTLSL